MSFKVGDRVRIVNVRKDSRVFNKLGKIVGVRPINYSVLLDINNTRITTVGYPCLELEDRTLRT